MKVNLEAVEALHVFWTMLAEREKVGDAYLQTLADMEVFKETFDEDFDRQSFIKVLSAITNKEMLNGMNKKEGRFWNYNLWVMEDMSLTQAMVDPVKTLNVEALEPKGGTVFFVPMNTQLSFRRGDDLYINFFKIMANPWGDDQVTIDELSIKDFIQREMA